MQRRMRARFDQPPGVLQFRPRTRTEPRERLHSALRAAAGAVASLALGLGSLYLAVRPGTTIGEVSNGPWHSSVVTGSPQADLYTRARVAVDLLLALRAPESIYYTAATDSEGRPLDARCEYRLEGRDIPARWWSLTSYGADRFLIPNPAGRYSVSRSTVVASPEGLWQARISRERQPGNWLPSGEGRFTLTLRLFDPAPVATESPRSIALPRVLREACS